MTATPEPSATTVATELTLTKVDSLSDLYDRLQEAGLSCDEYKVMVKNLASSCDDGQVLLTYDDGSKKRSEFYQTSLYTAWSVIVDQERQDEIGLLVGPNWFIRIGLTDAKTLRDDYLGGVVLH